MLYAVYKYFLCISFYTISGFRGQRAGNRSHTKRPCEIKPGSLSGTWCYLSLEPSATLSFHQENSVIAEGLVPLRVPGLEFTGLVVLCFCCQPSGPLSCGDPRARKSPVQMHRAKYVPTRTRTATTGVGGRYSIQLSYKNPFGFTNLYIIRHWPEKYKERMRRRDFENYFC